MPTPRPLVTAGTVLVTLSIGLAGCRDSGSSTSGDAIRPPTTTVAPEGQPPAEPTETVEIGLALPLNGPDVTTATGLRDAAELAVRHANADARVRGITLRLVTVDTGSAEDGTAKAIARLARRSRVVAVVAAVPAGSAARVADALGEDGLALLDPFDHDPALTPPTGPRPVPTLFRLAPDDLDVVPFAAAYARRDLGASAVALVGDPSPAATAALDTAAAQLGAVGASVVSRVVLPSADDPDAGAAIGAALRAAGASAVLVHGSPGDTASVASVLASAPPGERPTVVAIAPGACAPGAQTSAPDGVLCVAPAVPVASLATAQAFAEDHAAAGFGVPTAVGAPLVYDAVGVVVDALARTAPSGPPGRELRARVTAAVASARLAGATGTVSFDPRGDATAPVVSVLRAEAGAWATLVSRPLG